MAEYDLAFLTNLDGWTVAGAVGTFSLAPGDWRAVVRPMRVSGRSYERFHVGIIDGGGTARYAATAATVPEARRIAESRVRGLMTAGREVQPPA